MAFSVYSNGKRVSDAVFLRNFSEGEIGVFESLRTYAAKIFREEEHLDRFAESVKTAGVSASLPRSRLKSEIHSAVQNYRRDQPQGKSRRQDIFIRITFWNAQLFVMVGERRHPPEIYKNGVVLKTTTVRRSSVNAAAPQIKTNAYQNAVLAALQPSSGTYEWLFLDQDGYAVEVSIGNVFIIYKNNLLTPPATGILNGVTRRFVIECALPAGISTEERPLTRHDIYNAHEAFLTNTSWEVLPVCELDGRRIGTSVPGPLTLKIQRLFKQKVLRECRRSK